MTSCSGLGATTAGLSERSGFAGRGSECRLAWASAIARRATVADKFNTVLV
jgi:hypothetical protein